jgi:uracil phosphoribosyltransferase
MPDITVTDHPLIQHKLSIMRDIETSTNAFRRLLREIAQLMAYEVTRDMPLATRPITTPLTTIDAPVLDGKKLALISIMRAGNGMLDGVLDLLPSARVGFVGLQRNEETLRPEQYYCKLPDQLSDRLVVLLDPMLATGFSACAAIDLIKAKGAQQIIFMSLVAAPEGVAQVSKAHPDVKLVTAALDRHLNENGYIVPGLGDAGDRIFGTK